VGTNSQDIARMGVAARSASNGLPQGAKHILHSSSTAPAPASGGNQFVQPLQQGRGYDVRGSGPVTQGPVRQVGSHGHPIQSGGAHGGISQTPIQHSNNPGGSNHSKGTGKRQAMRNRSRASTKYRPKSKLERP
jgi:hypothetical protein